ncbi:uncharacterized protein LOC127872287 [Dreissena polymorpha]|uniref:uncharacterized protein LOC127872287 n=1 Tax=Dreissena polymorpha TaxID=45954 RepID=UPI0022643228|nr:uncharacterized protein LOC127872287 [Dreissena polymorpha]
MFVGCSALTVTQAPADTAVLIGRNATIACIVTNKASSESVQWKFRSNGSSTFNPVTFDSNILGSATKYAIQTVYNLTIITAATSDEGVYRCTAGTTDYDAKLTVVDLPSSVSLTMNGAANAGTTVNLTCTANNGRPTPNLRWLINNVERTSSAILQTGSVSATGYIF